MVPTVSFTCVLSWLSVGPVFVSRSLLSLPDPACFVCLVWMDHLCFDPWLCFALKRLPVGLQPSASTLSLLPVYPPAQFFDQNPNTSLIQRGILCRNFKIDILCLREIKVNLEICFNTGFDYNITWPNRYSSKMLIFSSKNSLKNIFIQTSNVKTSGVSHAASGVYDCLLSSLKMVFDYLKGGFFLFNSILSHITMIIVLISIFVKRLINVIVHCGCLSAMHVQ